jgi:hypothetical protein
MPDIIKRALMHTVTDIGQLSALDVRILNRAVKQGLLSKGKGGGFPRLKTVYAHPGYDFQTARARLIAELF